MILSFFNNSILSILFSFISFSKSSSNLFNSSCSSN